MTDTSIRAELRRAAMEKHPWIAIGPIEANVIGAFRGPYETFMPEGSDGDRWFFLLIAEAL